MQEAVEGGEGFGWALTTGDFNGDGFADLAVSAVGEALGVAGDAGVVHILYGSTDGLSAAGNQVFHQNRPGIKEAVEGGEGFGWALTTGDFNGDGFADLAVSAIGEALGVAGDAGVVHILYGSTDGLSAAGNQVFHQNHSGVQEVAEERDWFGWTLTTGDFNGDGFADLAVSAPTETLGAARGAGIVHILYGSANGLTARGSQVFHQNRPGIKEAVEGGEGFGWALTTGDFNGDGFADLAVSAPTETLGAARGAGIVHILYGSTDGLSAAGNQVFHQNRSGVPEIPEANDLFGWSTAAADFDNDGFTDLAIEAPGEDLNLFPPRGAVHVLYGRKAGLSSSSNQLFPFGSLRR